MLNKKICLDCFLEAERCARERHKGSLQRIYLVSEFKHVWLMGMCRCCKATADMINIKSQPPENCPYILEQMMSNE